MKKPIMNPPAETGADIETLIAVLAPIIARLCAKPAEVLELSPRKPRKQR